MAHTIHKPLSRRALVKAMGAGAATVSLSQLIACNGASSPDMSETPTESPPPPAIEEPTDDQLNNTGFDEITSDVAGADWASGGTAAISAAFPPANPFKEGLGTVCKTTASYTLGPCYFNPDEYRQDISDGELGVPMIIALKVVDNNCQPIANADVDIWHANREGAYSANSSGSSDAGSFRAGFCSDNNANALQSRWFRGVQKTDEHGFAYFKSCFPGWYRGRTTHIHFKIMKGNVQSLVSQFCYEDTMSNAIYKNHPEYTGEEKDTLNARDNVFGSDYNDYAFYILKNDDNSMTAYKTIQIQS